MIAIPNLKTSVPPQQTKKAGNEYSFSILLPAYFQRVHETPPSIDLPIFLILVYVFWYYDVKVFRHKAFLPVSLIHFGLAELLTQKSHETAIPNAPWRPPTMGWTESCFLASEPSRSFRLSRTTASATLKPSIAPPTTSAR